ncbi:response regulator receiver modulated diguanylate cyclase [Gloeothece citriformis PCC 7424]|uniref:Response regulator receiver modulated diguanylate cyclase n=1 Tax=Gloeothece citriformis (strain PCC 7424) TaxID=65393 RepID=B7K9G5_GLOC7|nr:diguanylate cyclase [Gloeothece citriformis]ACK68648.1 response regulator receiver modulated diguanylate cyclase [Gloeothece citriformis PCC 7424]
MDKVLNQIEPFNPEDFLILIVDDISKNLQLVVEILDEVGYATTFAISGKQALERVKIAHPDLILLDLMMPEMNGLQVCEKLKSDANYAEIPIIFLTASDEQEDLLQAFKMGAVDYVTKPFKSGELLARVKTHLELKRTKDALKMAYAELEKLANTDPLTGVANRRALLNFGEQEFYRAQRYHCPFSLLIIDLDYFKKINDSYGHDIGDLALKTVTEAVNKAIRKIDLLGRFGGEEFVVILPGTKLKDACIVAQRICRLISEVSLSVEQKTLNMTASIGVAAYNKKDKTINEIIHRADQGLYQAKNQGRNQVVVYDIGTVENG